jgi:hypothetical protein
MEFIRAVTPLIKGTPRASEIWLIEVQEGEGEEAETIKCYVRKAESSIVGGLRKSLVRVFWVGSLAGQSRTMREEWFAAVDSWVYNKWPNQVGDITHYRTIKY